MPRRVLEIGTGSGYQCAVLASLVEQVYTVERIDELLRNARRRFRKLGTRQHPLAPRRWPARLAGRGAVRCDHGHRRGRRTRGRAARPARARWRLVAPVGPPGRQELLRVRDGDEGWQRETLAAVSFVPLLGVGDRLRGANRTDARASMKLFKPLYESALRWAACIRAPTAGIWRASVSSRRSSSRSLPEVMLAPMVLARPQALGALCHDQPGFSVLGALVGYALGHYAFDLVRPLLESTRLAASASTHWSAELQRDRRAHPWSAFWMLVARRIPADAAENIHLGVRHRRRAAATLRCKHDRRARQARLSAGRARSAWPASARKKRCIAGSNGSAGALLAAGR